MASAAPMLEIHGLSKTFPPPEGLAGLAPVRVLEQVNLTVQADEFVCLLGPSGCGKTTLIRIVSGLIPSEAGEIRVGGRSTYQPGTDVCMVFQNHGLFPWRTALENVEFGLKMRKVPADKRRPAAQRYLEMVGLAGFERHYPHQLSGGMQQRIGLARALACEPRVLLMDEPFAAVDAQTRERLQGELLTLWQQHAMTIVFVTHSIDEAVYLADRVLVMGRNPGHIAAEVSVPLPRPRDRETTAYVELLRTVRHALERVSHGD